MNRRTTVVLLSIAAVAVALLGCSGKKGPGTAEGAAPSAVKAVELSYSIFFPSSHLQAQTAEAWAREVEKRTDGRVSITMFPGETLTTRRLIPTGFGTGYPIPRRNVREPIDQSLCS